MPDRPKPSLLKSLDLSIILAGIGTVVFYGVMFQPALKGTILHRYTTEHPVDYVIVALFLWGVVDTALKILSFPRELWAIRTPLLAPRNGREPLAAAKMMLAEIHARPHWLTESRLGQRAIHSLDYVVEYGAGDDYREHLKYLADKAHDDRYARYTLLRFIIGVTPILGFLGTVVHFGSALSGISFEQMAERLADVVSEMGQAFNTTTVALAAAMTIMFAMFLCERIEVSIDRVVDRFTDHELANRFEVRHQNLPPLLGIVQSANEEALKMISATLDRQIDSWAQAMGILFKRFDERQQVESAAWSSALATLQDRQQVARSESEARLASVLTQLESRLGDVLVQIENRQAETLTQLETRQTDHLKQIHSTFESIVHLRGDVKELGKTFQGMLHGEGKLVELQQTLTTNLRVLHETQQFDDALHGLTAAIHLLTKRHRNDSGESLAA
jgi:biopolymer transport protein ExbB/TolQ